jgi:aspartate-semialdehyde dehydrogenase
MAALLGRPIPTTILSARSGVFHGHFLRIELRLGGDAPEASGLLASFRAQKHAFDVVDPEDLSGPVESAGRDETLLLRCETSGRRVALTLAADHLRRAGALLAVRLAEQAAAERGWLVR